MPEGINYPDATPYYQPGVVRFDRAEAQLTGEEGIDLAMLLETGNLSVLPGEVRTWLVNHTGAINNIGTGELRNLIAAALEETPYTEATAAHIGSLIRSTVHKTNESLVALEEVEAENLRIINRMFGGDSTA